MMEEMKARGNTTKIDRDQNKNKHNKPFQSMQIGGKKKLFHLFLTLFDTSLVFSSSRLTNCRAEHSTTVQ